MFDLIAPFLIGLFGSVHCLGMCGPLVMAYSLHLREPGAADGTITAAWSRGIKHHLAFQSGRLFSYGFLGALAAGLANAFGLSLNLAGARGGLTLAGGTVMIVFGLALLRVFPFGLPSFGSGSFFGRVFPPLFKSRQVLPKIALGIATGFLPCMLSWAMIVKAATAPTPLGGFLTMVFFGLGTVPVLFFTGVSASLLTLKIRLAGERLAACSVLAMGCILIFKGARYFV